MGIGVKWDSENVAKKFTFQIFQVFIAIQAISRIEVFLSPNFYLMCSHMNVSVASYVFNYMFMAHVIKI